MGDKTSHIHTVIIIAIITQYKCCLRTTDDINSLVFIHGNHIRLGFNVHGSMNVRDLLKNHLHINFAQFLIKSRGDGWRGK